MAFESGDYLRVLKALNWHFDHAETVKSALFIAEADSDREAAILETLTQLEAVKTRFQSVRGGDNAGLIKADVLAWDEEKRVENFHDQINALQQELANLLGLEWGWTQSVGTQTLPISTW